MMRYVLLIPVLLAGCAEVQKVSDDLARDSARAAIDQILVTRFPFIDGNTVTPFTDCIIDNASGKEIGTFAKAALVGVDDSTAALAVDISQRPDTVICFAKAATL